MDPAQRRLMVAFQELHGDRYVLRQLRRGIRHMEAETADAVHADLSRAQAEVRGVAHQFGVADKRIADEPENVASAGAERRRREIAAAAQRRRANPETENAERDEPRRAEANARARTG